MENYPIDFVLTWVDGSDEEWQKKKAQYSNSDDEQTNGKTRYRDWELLRYWFRGVEQYTPWVRNVFFVTCGHFPKWLNVKNERLKCVSHESFIPSEYLPTFSSHSIELNIHKIKGLSDHFVYFNDDVFLLRALEKEKFFKDGLPRDVFIQSFTAPEKDAEVMCSIAYHDLEIINKNYNRNAVIKKNIKKFFCFSYGKDLLRNIYAYPIGKLTGLKAMHSATSLTKETYMRVWERDFETLHNTCKNKFRSKDDVNQWLLAWDQIMRGEFYPLRPSDRPYFTIGDPRVIQAIERQKNDIICLNDGDASVDFEAEKTRLISAFEKILPDKSSFEK